MNIAIAATIPLSLAACATYRQWFTAMHTTRVLRALHTVMDVYTIQDAERLLRICAQGNVSTDTLLYRLERLLSTFPPNDRMMQRLDDIYCRTTGSGGREEFCITTLYVISLQTLNRLPPQCGSMSVHSHVHVSSAKPTFSTPPRPIAAFASRFRMCLKNQTYFFERYMI